MINLKEVRDAYEELSGTLSSVVRQINFAGIAIVWIFVDQTKNEIPQLLLNACLFIGLSIILDAFQYMIGTTVWYWTYRQNHKLDKKDEEIEIQDNETRNVLPWVCLYLKFFITLIGYAFIIYFLAIHFTYKMD